MSTKVPTTSKTPFKVYVHEGKITDRYSLEMKFYVEEKSKFFEMYGLPLDTFIRDKDHALALREKARLRVDDMPYYELTSRQHYVAKRIGAIPAEIERKPPISETEAKSPSAKKPDPKTSDSKSAPATSDKDDTEKTIDESYENCFGLINEDAQDFYGRLSRPSAKLKGTIAEAIESNEKMTVEHCKERLSTITSEHYDEKARGQFVILNHRLSHLGVAPRWRGINRDERYKHSKRERTPEQEAFLRDVQVFDMEWVFKRYHGHLVNSSWHGAMEGIFTSDTFNSKQAAIIAEMAITPAKKADYLMLTSDMQKELFMLRSKETDDFIRGLLDQSMRMRNDLRTSAKRNRRRGQKLEENIQVRVDLWLASKLIPGSSIAMTLETYQLMTGAQLTRSNCQRIIRSMNDSLKEVGSKHVLS